VVAFVDDDRFSEAEWHEGLLPAFADRRVAAAGGIVMDHKGLRCLGIDSSSIVVVSGHDFSAKVVAFDGMDDVPAAGPLTGRGPAVRPHITVQQPGSGPAATSAAC
jgi:hypothetical protein